MPKEIVQTGDPVLRQTTIDIPVKDITSPKIQKIIADMKTSLRTQDDGVALAGPQIGLNLSIFVVSGKVFSKAEGVAFDDMVCINPVISKLSRQKEMLEEGCLSVRPFYGKVLRSKKATINAYDENGKKFQRGASGLLAQIFQHETDHLKGILFIDKAENITAMPQENEDAE
jgi:peptide deformylase